MKQLSFLLLLFAISCVQIPTSSVPTWKSYDETAEVAESQKNTSARMKYKLIQSRVQDKNAIWKSVGKQLDNFDENDYAELYPLIFNQDIPSMQRSILNKKLTYEKLTQWYLFRILKFENDPETTLNGIISINPNAVAEAKKRDAAMSPNQHPIFGMPVLIKDNIGLNGVATTAGAAAFANNFAPDAFIVQRIKEKGGIILGKTNLSEWANYLCGVCPNGYSAVGGQTLNAYGRRTIDTGGSSAGSGVTMAANYAAAAVGTETSGSILSPSSASSLVGLKPTVGLLSRGGIVPISTTLDTPGPMTRSVADNAILLSAMSGEDGNDTATTGNPKGIDYLDATRNASVTGMRFGVIKDFLTDSVYKATVEKIKSMGGLTFEFEPEKVNFSGFGTLLDLDMRKDVPDYIEKYGDKSLKIKTVNDVMAFNLADTTNRMPYGQARFEGIINQKTPSDSLQILSNRLRDEGIRYFETPMQQYKLDAVLSVNNYSAGFAAAAKYPALTVPMGYTKTGQPAGITFIARPFEEGKLLKMGYAFEQATKARKIPKGYN